mmetsp:Transcript_17800/g.27513  ORF Transcript_17800/g.27513 Transcript_17800/m.27513 type:complete len:123 (+) Transcript_17800:2-370(+)
MSVGPEHAIKSMLLHLGQSEFASGLTFVGISRATEAGVVALDRAPDLQRLQAMADAYESSGVAAEDKRLMEMSERTIADLQDRCTPELLRELLFKALELNDRRRQDQQWHCVVREGRGQSAQ